MPRMERYRTTTPPASLACNATRYTTAAEHIHPSARSSTRCPLHLVALTTRPPHDSPPPCKLRHRPLVNAVAPYNSNPEKPRSSHRPSNPPNTFPLHARTCPANALRAMCPALQSVGPSRSTSRVIPALGLSSANEGACPQSTSRVIPPHKGATSRVPPRRPQTLAFPPDPAVPSPLPEIARQRKEKDSSASAIDGNLLQVAARLLFAVCLELDAYSNM
ncbi:hypothetical protein BV22DRAFT_614733 [Leucogyrophana mollusca]|uniref:Uncharacterized protein n=1 Tax=Leucogyrophana mollusca TaxID=85980 RepID=A0ACB8BCI2_9AGAM|nr:hypothetical protein BV22DRAFT_614733 [Leucogyrophana mollusca]